MSYIVPIKTALFTFPFLAFLFTIPFILAQYHKYGSIHKLRVCIVYSFILYLLTIYFLVILPLPKVGEVTKPVSDMVQLYPFSFIQDFLKETSFVITDFNTYLKVLKEPAFYTVIFNILMTIPFGMYLRYYFKYSWKKVTIYSFFLSLFFELTQLTGLYFIYPYPYRLFDVDDLLMNTIGGVLGYHLMGLLKNFLPTRDKIDEDSKKEGEQVSGLRRLTVFFLDLFLYLIVSLIFKIIFKNFMASVFVSASFYFLLIPLFSNKKTIGSKFLNVQFLFPNCWLLRQSFRILFYYFYYLWLPYHFLIAYSFLEDFLHLGKREAIFLFFGILGFLFFFYLIHILVILGKRKIYYDSFFKITYHSTIQAKTEDFRETD